MNNAHAAPINFSLSIRGATFTSRELDVVVIMILFYPHVGAFLCPCDGLTEDA
jgi:hypothetical protein